MKRIVIAIASSVLALGVLAGVAFGHPTGKRHTSFGFAGVRRVVLDDTQGTVRVTAGGTVDVHVDRTSTTLFARATDAAHRDGDVLYLASQCNHVLCAVDYRVTVPRGTRLKIGGKNVDVSVDGAPGSIGVTATGEGKIELSLDRAVAVVAAHTRRGQVAITVPHGVYAVDAQAADGRTTITGVTESRGAKHIIGASSGSGDVTITGR